MQAYFRSFLKAILYTLSILQTGLTKREWLGVGFLSSLHYKPRANLTLFAMALMEMVSVGLFSVNLYFVLVDNDTPLNVLLNATALNFCLELENMATSLFHRRNVAAQDALSRLGVKGVSYNTCVAYMAASPSEWAPYGLHRMRSLLARDVLLWLHRFIGAAVWVVHLACYVLIISGCRHVVVKLMVPIEESAADDQSFEGYSNLLAVIGFASDSIDDEELAVEFRDLALGKIESDWGYQVGITSMIESPTYKLTKNQALRLVEIAETNCSKSDQKFITEIMKRRDQFSDFYEE